MNNLNRTGTLFGMTSSASSFNYTTPAIQSFFKNTVLGPRDTFILIDNDNVWSREYYAFVNLIHHEEPKTFSQNLNLLINIAHNNDQDLVFLSNDVIITPDWLFPLEKDDVITIPTCNQTHRYSHNGLTLVEEMNIEDYQGHYSELCEIVEYHKKEQTSDIFERFLMPFYLFRIPKNIYRTVGYFDENFINGGEDIDYRIRSLLSGFKVQYMTKSYVLHFNGKSTWRGQESQENIKQRDQIYRKYFEEKWGSDLKGLLLTNEIPAIVLKKHNLIDSNLTYNDVIKEVYRLSNKV